MTNTLGTAYLQVAALELPGFYKLSRVRVQGRAPRAGDADVQGQAALTVSTAVYGHIATSCGRHGAGEADEAISLQTIAASG